MRQIQSAALSRKLQEPEETDGRYVRPAEFLAFIFPMKMTGQPAATMSLGRRIANFVALTRGAATSA